MHRGITHHHRAIVLLQKPHIMYVDAYFVAYLICYHIMDKTMASETHPHQLHLNLQHASLLFIDDKNIGVKWKIAQMQTSSLTS